MSQARQGRPSAKHCGIYLPNTQKQAKLTGIGPVGTEEDAKGQEEWLELASRVGSSGDNSVPGRSQHTCLLVYSYVSGKGPLKLPGITTAFKPAISQPRL
jgi:hypothetical protein